MVTSNMNVVNATELYTYKLLKWYIIHYTYFTTIILKKRELTFEVANIQARQDLGKRHRPDVSVRDLKLTMF